MIAFHPAFVLVGAALISTLTTGLARRVVLVAGTLATLWSWSLLAPGTVWLLNVAGFPLELIRADALSLVFGLVFAIVTLVGTIYALHNDNRWEGAATLIYAGGGLGVVFAGDYVTLFVFWEVMAVASLFVVWAGKTVTSAVAGYRYLLVHVFGGSLLFAGILIQVSQTGSTAVGPLTDGGASPVAFWLILLGVSINAAIPPLHAWLTDAYPEASITGSVFLSAFTTKTAVYVLIRLFPGAEVLVWTGVIMALYGVVYAVLENDIRRLLAYHIISQVGYMVAGVGMGTALSLNGATAHAYSHILYKSLLFMGAGAVIYATGLRKLTELGGIAGRMKLVVLLYAVGAVSISGFPLFNGFISKSMIVSAATESHLPTIELLLTLASVGTFLHTGLKLPYFTFFGPGNDRIKVSPVPTNMLFAMGLGAVLCTTYGLFPELLYAMLPFGAEYHPYTLSHVLDSVQLLVGTALGFRILLHKLGGEATISLDTDWFYRKPLAARLRGLVAGARDFGAWAHSFSTAAVGALWRMTQAPLAPDPGAPSRSPDYDPFRFRLPIGVTVFWVLVYFVAVVIYALI